VLTISRIAPQKDLGTLVEAAAALRAPCRWVVVGDGDPDLRRAMEDRVRRTGAPVELVGARADAADLLRAADVFVLPSTWEARALVVQEAMAAGVPVVASDTGGLRDLVEGVGLLVPVGDAATLADRVEAVLLDPDLHATLASRSRRAAAALPDGAGAAGEWLTWYAAVVDARGGHWRADRR
jgi:glycosyltransferase involved in cell wall biosynthesis